MLEIILQILFALILGAVLGSFVNVLIIRWHGSVSLTGRSYCPSCKKVIHPKHLVPIISWLALKGRCAFCKKKIHYQYPLIEFICSLLAVAAILIHNPFLGLNFFSFILLLTLSIGLVVPVVMDLRWKELPLEYLIGLGIWILILRYLILVQNNQLKGEVFTFDVLAILIGLSFFGVQYLVSRGRWIGGGDIYFGAFMGAVLGWPLIILGIYIAYLFGGLLAFIGLLFGFLKKGDKVPFAPALALGTFLAYIYGGAIMNWLNF